MVGYWKEGERYDPDISGRRQFLNYNSGPSRLPQNNRETYSTFVGKILH